tara:strand:- start:223 stop:810 length:588 start_codon:yes stop_codon:yes gene_type:complete
MNKNIFFIVVLINCNLIFGEPQGWGVYLGGSVAKGTGEKFEATGIKEKRFMTFPDFGISRGVILNEIPIVLGGGFQNKGYKIEFGKNEKEEVIARYFEMWVMMQHPFGPVFAKAGFFTGMFIDGIKKKEYQFLDSTLLDDENLSPNKYGLDFGTKVGLEFPIATFSLSLEYIMGFKDQDETKLNNLSFSIRYYIN